MRRCLVRAMYLSAFVVAMSTWGAILSVRPLPLPLTTASHYGSSLSLSLSLSSPPARPGHHGLDEDNTDTGDEYAMKGELASCQRFLPFIQHDKDRQKLLVQ